MLTCCSSSCRLCAIAASVLLPASTASLCARSAARCTWTSRPLLAAAAWVAGAAWRPPSAVPVLLPGAAGCLGAGGAARGCCADAVWGVQYSALMPNMAFTCSAGSSTSCSKRGSMHSLAFQVLLAGLGSRRGLEAAMGRPQSGPLLRTCRFARSCKPLADAGIETFLLLSHPPCCGAVCRGPSFHDGSLC